MTKFFYVILEYFKSTLSGTFFSYYNLIGILFLDFVKKIDICKNITFLTKVIE